MIPAGWRVVLVRDVERFPHFIARKGMKGTVVECSAKMARVRMDDHLEMYSEWNNEIHWYEDDRADFALDVVSL